MSVKKRGKTPETKDSILTYNRYRVSGKPVVLLAGGGLAVPSLRSSCNKTHPEVVDILRQERGALCVCLNCGETWDEGGTTGTPCQ